MKQALSAFCLGAALLIGRATAQEPPVLEQIDALVEPYLGEQAPGIGVLAMRDGEVVHMRGYGLADLEAEIPVDENTVFDLASVSKQMTGLAAMLLIEEGRLHRGTKLGDVLPAFAAHETGGRALTVDDLLRHVSGLPDYLGGVDGLEYGPTTTNAEVIDWLAAQPLVRAPGTAFEYSNSGYLVLGTLVAAVDGQAGLAATLEARIWEKLGMEATGLVAPAEGVEPASIAKGYAGMGGEFVPSAEPNISEGDGNVFSSLADLARYEAGLARSELLHEDLTAALFATGMMDDGSPLVQEDGKTGYGFGWNLETIEGIHHASHSGSWMGTSTFYLRNLSSGLTVIVLANGEDMDSEALAQEIDTALQ
jgi:CubicO group peptidase (beta-lactamase class C family)